METGIDGNCPTWKGASKVYSKAYDHMNKHGADYALIKVLNGGNEEEIKAEMLRINTGIIIARQV
jgi:hypothetical protein